MSEIFNKIVESGGKNRDFRFERVFYGPDLWYHITFDNTDLNKQETFRMRKDEDGQWKIAAQALPMWIHETELTFNDIIEENS